MNQFSYIDQLTLCENLSLTRTTTLRCRTFEALQGCSINITQLDRVVTVIVSSDPNYDTLNYNRVRFRDDQEHKALTVAQE